MEEPTVQTKGNQVGRLPGEISNETLEELDAKLDAIVSDLPVKAETQICHLFGKQEWGGSMGAMLLLFLAIYIYIYVVSNVKKCFNELPNDRVPKCVE